MAEKTEAPTPRRREEARAKGQGIGRSWEFSMGLTLGVAMLALASLLPGTAATLVSQTQNSIVNMNPYATSDELLAQTGGALLTTLILVLPLALLVMVAGVAGNLVSGGLVLSYKAVRFDPQRINPITGMRRLLDKQALVRLGLASAKLAILAAISWQVVGSRIPSIVATQGETAGDIAATCLSAIFQLGLTITILLACVALADFVVQRRRAQESIRMTKEEVKQEYKEQEGDPQIRGARRRRARQMAFARMMDAVPTADVIITNPTTLAVALKYDSLTMRAPRIVAKGQRLMAERIKKIAREHRVPVVEDKPLARALFARPVGSEIPAHLYRAVARLLVLVHQARFAGRAGRTRWTAPQARAAASGLASAPWWSAAESATPASGGPAGEIVEAPATAAAGVARATATELYGGRPAGDEDAAVELGPQPDDLDGQPDDRDAESDAAAATSRFGGLSPIEGETVEPRETSDHSVDEDELAAAMAADEFADVTPEEMALLEAERLVAEEERRLGRRLDRRIGEIGEEPAL